MSADWCVNPAPRIDTVIDALEAYQAAKKVNAEDLATHERGDWRLENRESEAKRALGDALNGYINAKIAERLGIKN